MMDLWEFSVEISNDPDDFSTDLIFTNTTKTPKIIDVITLLCSQWDQNLQQVEGKTLQHRRGRGEKPTRFPAASVVDGFVFNWSYVWILFSPRGIEPLVAVFSATLSPIVNDTGARNSRCNNQCY